MADNIQLITFPGSLVTAQYDAILQEIETGDSGVITGCSVTMSNANTLHVSEGFGVLCGREFHAFESNITVTLSSSGTKLGRLYVHMDLSNTAEPISLRTEVGSTLTPCVQNANVNINNGVYEINLATFSVGTLTISNVVNVAPIIEAGGAGLSNLAYVEPTAVASQSYLKGQFLVLAGQFYEVTKSTGIASGASLVPGNNITARTVGEILYRLNSGSGNYASNILSTYTANTSISIGFAPKLLHVITLSSNTAVGNIMVYDNTSGSHSTGSNTLTVTGSSFKLSLGVSKPVIWFAIG